LRILSHINRSITSLHDIVFLSYQHEGHWHSPLTDWHSTLQLQSHNTMSPAFSQSRRFYLNDNVDLNYRRLERVITDQTIGRSTEQTLPLYHNNCGTRHGAKRPINSVLTCSVGFSSCDGGVSWSLVRST